MIDLKDFEFVGKRNYGSKTKRYSLMITAAYTNTKSKKTRANRYSIGMNIIKKLKLFKHDTVVLAYKDGMLLMRRARKEENGYTLSSSSKQYSVLSLTVPEDSLNVQLNKDRVLMFDEDVVFQDNVSIFDITKHIGV